MDFYGCSAHSLLPGDVARMKSIARSFTETAEDVGALRRRLARIQRSGSAQVWRGPAATVLADYVDELPQSLTKVERSYEAAGKAVLGLATATRGLRLELDQVLVGARRAQDRAWQVDRELWSLQGTAEEDAGRIARLESERYGLRTQLGRCEEQVKDLQARLNTECRRTVERLGDAASLGLQNRNRLLATLDQIGDFLVEAYEDIAPVLIVATIALALLASGGSAAVWAPVFAKVVTAMKVADVAQLAIKAVNAYDEPEKWPGLVAEGIVSYSFSKFHTANEALFTSRKAALVQLQDTTGGKLTSELHQEFWKAAQRHTDVEIGLHAIEGAIGLSGYAVERGVDAHVTFDRFIGEAGTEDLRTAGYERLDHVHVYIKQCTVEFLE